MRGGNDDGQDSVVQLRQRAEVTGRQQRDAQAVLVDDGNTAAVAVRAAVFGEDGDRGAVVGVAGEEQFWRGAEDLPGGAEEGVLGAGEADGLEPLGGFGGGVEDGAVQDGGEEGGEVGEG